jgi:hypothetical protein
VLCLWEVEGDTNGEGECEEVEDVCEAGKEVVVVEVELVVGVVLGSGTAIAG